MKLLIISNMYPSANDPVYGTFVKVFADSMKAYNSEGVTQLIVIRGRDGGRWKRLLKYVSFYVGVLYNLLFHTYDLVYVHTIAYPVVPIRLAALFRHHLPLVFNVHGGDVPAGHPDVGPAGLPGHRQGQGLPDHRLHAEGGAGRKSACLRDFLPLESGTAFRHPFDDVEQF